jgi:osmoprotectant transport system substrate-binding protein
MARSRHLDWRSWQDDRHYFPPYQAVPLVRRSVAANAGRHAGAFDALGGKISAEEMQAMNEAVDGEHRDPAEVVREFRARKGL